ncbi:MAG: hypothetical protein AAF550_04310 [Myxococcota bacterium]
MEVPIHSYLFRWVTGMLFFAAALLAGAFVVWRQRNDKRQKTKFRSLILAQIQASAAQLGGSGATLWTLELDIHRRGIPIYRVARALWLDDADSWLTQPQSWIQCRVDPLNPTYLQVDVEASKALRMRAQPLSLWAETSTHEAHHSETTEISPSVHGAAQRRRAELSSKKDAFSRNKADPAVVDSFSSAPCAAPRMQRLTPVGAIGSIDHDRHLKTPIEHPKAHLQSRSTAEFEKNAIGEKTPVSEHPPRTKRTAGLEPRAKTRNVSYRAIQEQHRQARVPPSPDHHLKSTKTQPIHISMEKPASPAAVPSRELNRARPPTIPVRQPKRACPHSIPHHEVSADRRPTIPFAAAIQKSPPVREKRAASSHRPSLGTNAPTAQHPLSDVPTRQVDLSRQSGPGLRTPRTIDHISSDPSTVDPSLKKAREAFIETVGELEETTVTPENT